MYCPENGWSQDTHQLFAHFQKQGSLFQGASSWPTGERGISPVTKLYKPPLSA